MTTRSLSITEYQRPKEFLSLLQKKPSTSSEKNDFILGLVNQLINDPHQYETKPLLAIVTKQDQVMLAVFMTPPWPIVLFAETNPSPNVWSLLRDYLRENDVPVSGVNAPKNLSDRFAQLWCKTKDCKSTIKMTMKFLSLHEVQPIRPCRGHVLQADDTQYDLILKWAQQFQKEAKLNEDIRYIESHVKFSIQTGNAFLWVDEEPVCMTFRERPHNTGISIGYVYTPKELRQHGYATNCVAEVSRRCLLEGFHRCTLFTDMKNPISNSIYQKIGYRYVCDYLYYDFK